MMKKIVWILVLVSMISFSFAQEANSDKKLLRSKIENRVQNYQDKNLTGNRQQNLSWNIVNSLSQENQKALQKVQIFVQWKLKLVQLVENAANKVKNLAQKIWYDTITINDLLTQIKTIKDEYMNFSQYIIENKLNKAQINEKVKEYNSKMKTVIQSLKAELTNLKEFIKNRSN